MGRRNSEVELCFDSMSDLITNLAGGLILVVMLLLAVTREAPKTLEADADAATGKKALGEKSSRELFNRLNLLQVESARIDAELGADERTLRGLETKADDLLKRIEAVKADAAKEKK